MMRSSIKIVFGLLAFLALVVIMNGVSADTHTSQASGNADTAGTWDNGVPGAADNLVLTGAYNIAMNQAITYGTITIGAGYSGVATQGAVNFGYTDFSIAAGTWTGVETQTQTCSGDFTKTGGTITNYKLNLIMTGDGKSLTFNAMPNFYKMKISGNVTLASSLTFNGVPAGWGLTVDSGKTLTISSTKSLFLVYMTDAANLANSGTIAGAGTLNIYAYNNHALTLGIVSCSVVIGGQVGAGNIVLTAAGNCQAGDLTISDADAAQTVTYNLAGYSLSCTSITASTRGYISSTVAGSKITTINGITISANGKIDATNIAYIGCGGTFDPSAGTWTPDDGQVNMTGSYKSIKLGATQTFYNLQLANYNYNVTGAAPVSNVLRVIGLTPGERYSWLYGTTFISHKHLADPLGYVNLSAQTLAVHNLYHMDQCPTISSTPITSAIIGHQYSYDCNASEAGTWALTTSYADLDIDTDGVVSGFLSANELSPAGDSITINITFTDSVGGNAYQNYTITVGGMQEDLIPLGVGVISIVIIVGLTTLAIGSVRRKMH